MKNNSKTQSKPRFIMLLISAAFMLGVSQLTFSAEKSCPSKATGQGFNKDEQTAIEEAEDDAAAWCDFPKCNYVRSHVNCRQDKEGIWDCRASGSCS